VEYKGAGRLLRMEKALNVFGYITFVLSIIGMIVSLLLYVLRGFILYPVMLLGIALRPIIIISFALVALKLTFYSAGDAIGRDWHMTVPIASPSRSAILRDVVAVILMALTLFFWYQYGGLDSAHRKTVKPQDPQDVGRPASESDHQTSS